MALGYREKSVAEYYYANLKVGGNLSKLHSIKDSDWGHQLLGRTVRFLHLHPQSCMVDTETVTWGVPWKKVFLEMSKNS